MNGHAIGRALLALAVGTLPEEDRERWRGEWLAELDAIAGASKIRFALGACAGAARMARELHARRTVRRTVSVAGSDFARPAIGARPPYNAGFWA
jgi:hypothetical protein